MPPSPNNVCGPAIKRARKRLSISATSPQSASLSSKAKPYNAMKIIAPLFASLLTLSHISLALPLVESETNSKIRALVNPSIVENRRDITESRGLFSEFPVVGNLLQATTELPLVGNLVGDVAHSLKIL